MPEPRKTTQEPEAPKVQAQKPASITPIQPGMGGISTSEGATPEILSPGALMWIEKITVAWRASAMAIIETGRLLVAAKAALPDEYEAMLFELPFGTRTIERLMSIGRDTRLATHGSVMP